MAGKNRKKNLCSPLVVSTDCSRLKKSSYLHFFGSKSSSSHNHDLPEKQPLVLSSNDPSPPNIPTYHKRINDARATVQEYRKRVQQLEHELVRLDEWLNAKTNDAPSSDHSGRKSRIPEILRLQGDGGYLHCFNARSALLERSARNFAMQVSLPAVIPVEGRASVNISEVLYRMASMGKNRLILWLLESMPMSDISGTGFKGYPILPHTQDASLETIFLSAVGELEKLAMEGLKIQKNDHRERGEVKNDEKKGSRQRTSVGEEYVLEVMLMQMRDPEKEYEAAGDVMIGFVQARIEEKETETETESGILIRGVHVAGISAKIRDGMSRREDYLWCVSMTSCEGNCGNGSWKFERIPDIAFPLHN